VPKPKWIALDDDELRVFKRRARAFENRDLESMSVQFEKKRAEETARRDFVIDRRALKRLELGAMPLSVNPTPERITRFLEPELSTLRSDGRDGVFDILPRCDEAIKRRSVRRVGLEK
jgi:hypothetical protein